MKARVHRRRLVRGATGRRYSLCGGRMVDVSEPNVAGAARSNGIVAWFSGATLLLAASLSLYAIARPPLPTVDSGVHFTAPALRYSIADFFRSTR